MRRDQVTDCVPPGYAPLSAEFAERLSEPGLTFEGLDSIEEHPIAMGTEAGLFDQASSEEVWPEAIVEIQRVELGLASRLEECGGLAEWERRSAELAEPLRREFSATHWTRLAHSADGIPQTDR